MKIIKIKFIGMWTGFCDTDNFFYNILSKKYNIEFSDKPDYLIYSVFCPEYYNYLDYDCVRIFYSGENSSPDFDHCDYAIGFDNITYNDRFFQLPLFLCYDQLDAACHKHENVTPELLESKTEFANFVVGNDLGMPVRRQMFEELNKYKRVASVGTYLNNMGFVADTIDKKLEFQSKCRFSITFESCIQRGFITEKILHGFAAHTVPIYMGDEDIGQVFNEKAFINGHNYDNLQQIAEKVKDIEENKQLWLDMVSTPCFKDEDYPHRKLKELDDFLDNIFSQPLEKAYRRPLAFHAIRFKDDLKSYMELKRDKSFSNYLKCRNNRFARRIIRFFADMQK